MSKLIPKLILRFKAYATTQKPDCVCERKAHNYAQTLLAFLLTMAVGLIQAQPLLLTELPTGSLGAWANVLVEDGAPLSLEEVQIRQRANLFHKGERPVLTYGIGARPFWVHLELFNPTPEPMPLHLAIGTTWTDQIDVFLVQGNRVSASWQTGDEYPNAPGLTPGGGFTIPGSFAAGRSDLYIRVDSIDPLVLPITLMTAEQALSSEQLVHYSYGFIYGFLVALLAYNGMLYAGLKKRSHLYYSLYLVSLILLNLAYTGHGEAWLWPDQPQFQRYVILALMVVYGCSGLLFASRFLELAEHAPRVYKLVRLSAFLVLGLMALFIVTGSQLGAALLAFIFASLFSFGMVLLGIFSIHRGQVAGRYFLAAVIFGMLGAAFTTFAVWGLLPFNTLTYHGLEYGVIFEATLLALALSHHFSEVSATLSRVTVSRDELSVEVAERKLAEEKLRKSEESLKESQIIAGLGSYVVDISSGLWKSSEVLDQLLGIDKTYEHSAQGWRALIHPDDSAMLNDVLKIENFGSGKTFDKEFRIIRRDDRAVRWVHGLGKLEFDAQGQPLKMHGTIQDITGRKMAEEALLAAANAVEEASRAKSEFLSSMSHELRTPLNAILGFSQLIGMDAQLTESNKGFARQIERAGNHLLHLVNDLMDLSRIEAGKLEISIEPVAVMAVIKDSLELTAPIAQQKGIGINHDIGENRIATIRADYVRLRQVLINLLSNAIKYNRPQGTVHLACHLHEGKVRISVADTGRGIPPDKQSRIFNAFDRLGAEGGAIEGTGIGLVITKRIVEAMGGTIGFESVEGQGSTFWVEFPASETMHLPVSEALALDCMPEEIAHATSLQKVLYVEDNPINLYLMQEIFKRKPLELRVATTAELGIELARNEPPALILMDINLPGMNGYEALRILKNDARTAHIPVVAISANAMSGEVEQGLAAGFAAYFTKPVNISTLYGSLSKLIVQPAVSQDCTNNRA